MGKPETVQMADAEPHDIRCDCCEEGRRQKMAVRRGHVYEIRSQHHGKEHVVEVPAPRDCEGTN